MVLHNYVDLTWHGTTFKVNYNHQKDLNIIDRVFALLDGKEPCPKFEGPLTRAIIMSENGRGDSDYFSFRCCMNGNLHLTIKRPDLLQRLNDRIAQDHANSNKIA
jgi:hypothetical protein